MQNQPPKQSSILSLLNIICGIGLIIYIPYLINQNARLTRGNAFLLEQFEQQRPTNE